MQSVEHIGMKKLLIQLLNGAISRPTNLWVGLRYSPDGGSSPNQPPDVADTMATISATGCEVGGTTSGGYARQSISTSSITDAQSINDWLATLPEVTYTFTATPTQPQATHAFVCTGSSSTDNTGLLLISCALAATRSFGPGVTEDVVDSFKQT